MTKTKMQIRITVKLLKNRSSPRPFSLVTKQNVVVATNFD